MYTFVYKSTSGLRHKCYLPKVAFFLMFDCISYVTSYKMTALSEPTEFVYYPGDRAEELCWSEAATVRELIQFVSHLSQTQSDEGCVEKLNFPSSYYLVHTKCSLVVALDLSSYMFVLLRNQSSYLLLSLLQSLTHILKQLCDATLIGSEEREPVIVLTFIIFSFDRSNTGLFSKVLFHKLELRQNTVTELSEEIYSAVMSFYGNMECRSLRTSNSPTAQSSLADILQLCIYSFNFLPSNQHRHILIASLPIIDFPDMPAKNYIVTQLLDHRISCSFLSPQPSPELASLGYLPNYSAIRFVARVSQGAVFHPETQPSSYYIPADSNIILNIFQKLILTTFFQTKCDKNYLIESISSDSYPLYSNKSSSSKPEVLQVCIPASHLLASLFQIGFCLDPDACDTIAIQLSRPWDESTVIYIQLSEFNSQAKLLPLEVYISYYTNHLRLLDIQDYCVDSRNRDTLPFRTQQVEVFRQFYKELRHRITILDRIYNSNLTVDGHSSLIDDSVTDQHENSKRHTQFGPHRLKAILQNKVQQWHTWMTSCIFHLFLESPGDSDFIHAALIKWGGTEVGGRDFYVVQFEVNENFCFVSLDVSCPPLLNLYFGFHFSLSRTEINAKLGIFVQNIRNYFNVLTPKIKRSKSNRDSPFAFKIPYQFHTRDIADIFRFNFKRNGFLSYEIIKCYFISQCLSFPMNPVCEEDRKLLLQVAKLFVMNKVNEGWSVFKSNNYTTLFQQLIIKGSMNSLHKALACYFLYLEQVKYTWQLKVDFFLEPIRKSLFSNNLDLNRTSTMKLFDEVATVDIKMLECALNFSTIGFDCQTSFVPNLECLLNNCSTLIFDAPLFLEQGPLEESHRFNDQIANRLIGKLTDSSCLQTKIDVTLMTLPIYNTISETDHYLTNLICFFREHTDILNRLLIHKQEFRFLYKIEIDSSEAYFIAMPTCTQSLSQHLKDMPNYFPLPNVQTFPILIYYVAVDRVYEKPSCYFYGANNGMYGHPNMPVPLKHFLTYIQGEFNKSFVDVVVSYIAEQMPIAPTVFQTCLDYCNQERFHSSLDLTTTLKTLSTVTALRPSVSLSLDKFLKAKLPYFIPCSQKKGLYYFSIDKLEKICERNIKLSKKISVKADVKIFIQLRMSILCESGVCEDTLLEDLTLQQRLLQEENPIQSAVLGIDCYTFDTQPTEFSIIERDSERASSSGSKQTSEPHLSLPISHCRTSSLDRREHARESLLTADTVEAQILVKLIKTNNNTNFNNQMLDFTLTHDSLLTHLLEETQWQINDLTVAALSNNLTSTALLLEIVDHIKQGEELGKLTCTIYCLHENITYSMLALTPGTKERFMGELDNGIPGFRADKYDSYYNLKLIDESYASLSYWIVMEVCTESPKITFYIHYNSTDRQESGISSRWLFEQGNRAVESVCRKVFQILLLHDLYSNRIMYSQLSVDYHPLELEEDALCFFQSNLACPHQFEYYIPVHWRLGRQIAQSLAKKYLESLKCKNANSIYILEEDIATDRIYYMYINTVDKDTVGTVHSLLESRLGRAEDVLLRFDVYGVHAPSKRYQELVFNNIEDKMYNEILTKLCDSFSQQANIQLFAQDVTFLQPEAKVDKPEETATFLLPTFVELNLSSFVFYLFQYIHSTCTRLKKKCFAHDVFFQLPSYYPEANLVDLSENFFISAERPIQTRSIILIGVILVESISSKPLSFKQALGIKSQSPPSTFDAVLSELTGSSEFNSRYEISVMMWQHGNADCEKMRERILSHCSAALFDFVSEYYFLRIPYSPKFECYCEVLIKTSLEASPIVQKEQRTKPPSLAAVQHDSRDSTDTPYVDLMLSYCSNDSTQDKYANPLDQEFIKGLEYFTSHTGNYDASTLKRLTGDLPDTFTISRFFSLLLKHLIPICRSFEFTQDLFQQESEEINNYYKIDINSMLIDPQSIFPTNRFILIMRSPYHWLQCNNTIGEARGRRIISKKIAHLSSHSTVLKYPLDPNSENLSRDEPFFDTFKQYNSDDVIPRQSFIFFSVDDKTVVCCSYNCSKTIITQLADIFNSILSLIGQEVCIWNSIIELKEVRCIREFVMSEEVRDAFLTVFKQTVHSFSIEELLEKLNLNRISTNICDFRHFSADLNLMIIHYLNILRRNYVLTFLNKSKIPLGMEMKDIENILSCSTCIYHTAGDLQIVQYIRKKNFEFSCPHVFYRSVSIFPTCHKKNSQLNHSFLYSYVTQLSLSGFILILVNAAVENQYELYMYVNLECMGVILKVCLEQTHFSLQLFATSLVMLDEMIGESLRHVLTTISILSFEKDFFLGYVHSLLCKAVSNNHQSVCLISVLNSIISNSLDQCGFHSVQKLNVSSRNTHILDTIEYIIKHASDFGVCHLLSTKCNQSLLVYFLSDNPSQSNQYLHLFNTFPQLKCFLKEYEISFIFDIKTLNKQSLNTRTFDVYVIIINKKSLTTNYFTSSPLYAHSMSSDKCSLEFDFQLCCQIFIDCLLELANLQHKKEVVFQLFISNIKITGRRGKLNHYDVSIFEQSIHSYPITGILPSNIDIKLTAKRGRLTDFLKKKDPSLPGLFVTSSQKNDFSIYLFISSRDERANNFLISFFSTSNGLNEGIKLFHYFFHYFLHQSNSLNEQQIQVVLSNYFNNELEIVMKAFKIFTSHIFK